MRPNSRLDKATKGLRELVKRHNLQDRFQISENTIVINTTTQQQWGTIFYLAICILLPAGLLTYYLIVDNTNSVIFLLLLLELLMCYDLHKLVRGNTILTIDFTTKQLQVDNINGVFKKLIPSKTISFDDISHIEVKEESICSKYSRTRWLRLITTDRSNRKITLTDLDENFPISYIAKKVKFLIEVIIWTEKQNADGAVRQD